MPLIELSDQRSFRGLIDEPLRRFFFVVNFPEDFGFIDPSLVKSVDEQPFWDLSHVTQFQGGVQGVFPDKRTLRPITVVFHETVGLHIRRFFTGWQGRIFTPEGYYLPKRDYLRPIEIETLNNGNVAIGKYRYEGFPLKMSGMGLDVGSEDMVQPSITFAIESAERII